jgi:hypothetical protein
LDIARIMPTANKVQGRAAVTRLRRAGMDIICGPGNVYALRSGSASPSSGVDSLWAGIAGNLQSYYRNRAAVLAAA